MTSQDEIGFRRAPVAHRDQALLVAEPPHPLGAGLLAVVVESYGMAFLSPLVGRT